MVKKRGVESLKRKSVDRQRVAATIKLTVMRSHPEMLGQLQDEIDTLVNDVKRKLEMVIDPEDQVGEMVRLCLDGWVLDKKRKVAYSAYNRMMRDQGLVPNEPCNYYLVQGRKMLQLNIEQRFQLLIKKGIKPGSRVNFIEVDTKKTKERTVKMINEEVLIAFEDEPRKWYDCAEYLELVI